MSVDLVATLPRPVCMATVVDTAAATLSELLGLAAAPELCVTDPGTPLAARELRTMTLGVPGAERYVRVAVGEDAAWMMDGEHHPGGDDGIVLTVSPARTCVGVVLATAVALASALVAGGEFIDDEIGMLRPPVRDPRMVMDRTRLRDATADLAAASEKYLRQFQHLGGWPSAVN